MSQRRTAESLTPAQRRAVLASDPVTGELTGSPATGAALRARGLAVAYGRAGRHYLTGAGLALREELRERPAPDAPAPPTGRTGPSGASGSSGPSGSSGGPSGGFAAATGDGPEPEDDPGLRAAAVARAWAGVLEIRRVTGGSAGPGSGVPAPWERTRMVWAVALALEAAGVPPSAVDAGGRRTRAGYRVLAADEPGAVRVEWRGPAASAGRDRAERELRACAGHLAGRGWEALLYWGARRVPFLLVTPGTP
ncbi:hypothetical protein [Streptomyces sp. DH37]|uniref:hypothetical protein n=1 Tax=Streptomyces sp. DH37 TaxID=3040122 RepID=UPI0024419C38|nr:hypothetical protein [Streptomyces sp. DH37]MDG9703541.1 hypothetical protein [Streptomyces sp. DH37]